MADDKKEKSSKAEKGDKSEKGAKSAKSAKSPKPKAEAGGAREEKAPKASAAPARTVGRPRSTGKKPRLAVYYAEKVRPALIEKFRYTSAMQAPRFEKIVLNMGVGDALTDQKMLDAAAAEMSQIAGQKPAIRRAKKSIANFKLREGVPIGAKVTLRGARMYEFLDRLINVALPRVRDFRGVPPKGFDGRGNYALGLREQLIFPEIVYDKVDKVRGMDISIVTTARTDEDAKVLLTHLGMPFRE